MTNNEALYHLKKGYRITHTLFNKMEYLELSGMRVNAYSTTDGFTGDYTLDFYSQNNGYKLFFHDELEKKAYGYGEDEFLLGNNKKNANPWVNTNEYRRYYAAFNRGYEDAERLFNKP